MKVRGLIAIVMYCSLGSVAAQRTSAQPAPPAGLSVPAPLPPGITTAGATVPDWLIWRAFHDSMRFYSKQSPDAVKRLLRQKAGLTPEQADAVLQAGPGYLQEMERADSAAQIEAQQRYRSTDLPARRAAVIPRPAFRNGTIPPVHPPLQPGGGNLRQMMEQDGIIARLNRQKEDALAAHRSALNAILGPDRLAQLESWLKSNVAPGVKVFDKATLVAAPVSNSQGR
ncbi:MAG TPA: hypothetical protein VI653_15780 [Steroidobacteraceae bacterium]